jgi:hypothetical protein
MVDLDAAILVCTTGSPREQHVHSMRCTTLLTVRSGVEGVKDSNTAQNSAVIWLQVQFRTTWRFMR